jgi:hypothetical protein
MNFCAIIDQAKKFIRLFTPMKARTFRIHSGTVLLEESLLLDFFNDSWITCSAMDALLKISAGDDTLVLGSNIFSKMEGAQLENKLALHQEIAEGIQRRILQYESQSSQVVRFLWLPMNLQEVHWSLAMIDLQKHEILTYESLASFANSHQHAKALLLELFEQVRPGKWSAPKPNEPDFTVPEQPLGTGSCGFFVASFVEVLANASTTEQAGMWKAEHMPFIRLRWLAKLLLFEKAGPLRKRKR